MLHAMCHYILNLMTKKIETSLRFIFVSMSVCVCFLISSEIFKSGLNILRTQGTIVIKTHIIYVSILKSYKSY